MIIFIIGSKLTIKINSSYILIYIFTYACHYLNIIIVFSNIVTSSATQFKSQSNHLVCHGIKLLPVSKVTILMLGRVRGEDRASMIEGR